MKPAKARQSAVEASARRATNSAPRSDRTPLRADGPAPRSPDQDILGVASTVDRLSVFTMAARVAGLHDVLERDGKYTIFAPTDRAFARMPKPTLDGLLADPARLAQLLCHHVVPGRVKAPKPDAPGIALPIAGPELALTAGAGSFHVDGARLVKTNIRGANGVIHAIDTVLTVEVGDRPGTS
jgi:uncharacterized surface protein with fasciclin (FAS1) repeats